MNSGNSKTPCNIILLTIDGLGARFLGPYGNTWIDTPAINQLAAQGILFENCIAETNRSGQALASIFGVKNGDQDAHASAVVPAELDDVLLVYDSPKLSLHEQLAQAALIQFPDDLRRCDDWSDTHLARMFAALFSQLEDAADALRGGGDPFIAWCDSRSLTERWDAPLELALQFRAEDDPLPYSDVEPPRGEYNLEETDPDVILSFTHSYAAQVIVLDLCIAALFSCLQELELFNSTTIALTSSHGYPLGEHGFVGTQGNCLFGEAVHVPLIITSPDIKFQSRRYQSIIQHQFLNGTSDDSFLRSILDGRLDYSRLAKHCADFPIATCENGNTQIIQTPAWKLHRSNNESSLFVKPDDRWEVNNVARLCRDITEGLESLLAQIVATERNDRRKIEFDANLITPRA